MAASIKTLDDLKTYAEANFPEDYAKLPPPEVYHFTTSLWTNENLLLVGETFTSKASHQICQKTLVYASLEVSTVRFYTKGDQAVSAGNITFTEPFRWVHTGKGYTDSDKPLSGFIQYCFAQAGLSIGFYPGNGIGIEMENACKLIVKGQKMNKMLLGLQDQDQGPLTSSLAETTASKAATTVDGHEEKDKIEAMQATIDDLKSELRAVETSAGAMIDRLLAEKRESSAKAAEQDVEGVKNYTSHQSLMKSQVRKLETENQQLLVTISGLRGELQQAKAAFKKELVTRIAAESVAESAAEKRETLLQEKFTDLIVTIRNVMLDAEQ